MVIPVCHISQILMYLLVADSFLLNIQPFNPNLGLDGPYKIHFIIDRLVELLLREKRVAGWELWIGDDACRNNIDGRGEQAPDLHYEEKQCKFACTLLGRA